MSSDLKSREEAVVGRVPRLRIKALVRNGLLILLGYFVVAYLLLPLDWMQYSYRHPAIDDVPGITSTKSGIPGDPINIGLVGTEADLQSAMISAGWYPADPITLKSSVRIVADTLLHHSYDDAPVSSLYLWGRHQDFAFEKPLAGGPRRRHHVRFWRSKSLDGNGKPMWFGAVTFDVHVGLSHTTGEITHHIDGDIDRERNTLMTDLRQFHQLSRSYWIDRFHDRLSGKNGGGDHYYTDGRLGVCILKEVPEPDGSHHP